MLLKSAWVRFYVERRVHFSERQGFAGIESAFKAIRTGIQQPVQYLDLSIVLDGAGMLLPEPGFEQDVLNLVQRLL